MQTELEILTYPYSPGAQRGFFDGRGTVHEKDYTSNLFNKISVSPIASLPFLNLTDIMFIDFRN